MSPPKSTAMAHSEPFSQARRELLSSPSLPLAVAAYFVGAVATVLVLLILQGRVDLVWNSLPLIVTAFGVAIPILIGAYQFGRSENLKRQFLAVERVFNMKVDLFDQVVAALYSLSCSYSFMSETSRTTVPETGKIGEALGRILGLAAIIFRSGGKVSPLGPTEAEVSLFRGAQGAEELRERL